MKIIISFLIVSAISLNVLAVEQFQVELVKDVPLERIRIYDQTTIWMAENFKSSKAVIELKDKELGVIIGNATISANISMTKWLPAVYNIFSFKMKIEMKDNKFRMTFSDVKMVVDGIEKPIEDTNRASNEKIMASEFQKIADSLS